jgi:hypothetical protein
VRLRVAETPVYTEAVEARGKVESNPAMEALRQHPRNFLVVLGARMAENGLGYFFPVFGLSYVITTVGVPKSDALSALMLAFTIELFAILGFGTGPCPATHACDCGVDTELSAQRRHLLPVQRPGNEL